MNRESCAKKMAELSQDGNSILNEHFERYNEILLHVLASDLITEPLICLFQSSNRSIEEVKKYCGFIEKMWKFGDEYVLNVVEVTILERLSDDKNVWNQFGSYISEEFKEYVNTEVLTLNLMMMGVEPL